MKITSTESPHRLLIIAVELLHRIVVKREYLARLEAIEWLKEITC